MACRCRASLAHLQSLSLATAERKGKPNRLPILRRARAWFRGAVSFRNKIVRIFVIDESGHIFLLLCSVCGQKSRSGGYGKVTGGVQAELASDCSACQGPSFYAVIVHRIFLQMSEKCAEYTIHRCSLEGIQSRLLTTLPHPRCFHDIAISLQGTMHVRRRGRLVEDHLSFGLRYKNIDVNPCWLAVGRVLVRAARMQARRFVPINFHEYTGCKER